MPSKSVIERDTARYLRFLRNKGLLTDEHALVVSLIKRLVAQLELCASPSQFAQISKEIRAAIAQLPKLPPAEPKDEATEFVDSLDEDDDEAGYDAPDPYNPQFDDESD